MPIRYLEQPDRRRHGVLSRRSITCIMLMHRAATASTIRCRIGTVTCVTLLGTIRRAPRPPTTTTGRVWKPATRSRSPLRRTSENTFYQCHRQLVQFVLDVSVFGQALRDQLRRHPAISVVVSSNSFVSIGGLLRTVDFLLQEFVHYA